MAVDRPEVDRLLHRASRRRVWREAAWWFEWSYQNLVRLPVLCIFPLIAVLASAGLYTGTSQGQDFLRTLLARLEASEAHPIISTSNVCALFAHVALGLSAWHPARWLLARDFHDFPLDHKLVRVSRSRLPPILGSTPLFATGIGFLRVALEDTHHMTTGLVMAGAYIGLSGAMFVMLGDRASSMVARFRISPESGVYVDTMPIQAKLSVVWAFVSFLFLAVLLVAWPVSLPRVMGAVSLTLGCLSAFSMVGGYVLTYWPLSRGVSVRPAALLALLLFSAFNDNHDMRVADDFAKHPDAALAHRPTPEEYFHAWKARQAKCRKEPTPSGRVPLVVVAAAGGGIRAAFWSSAVLHDIRVRLGQGSAFDCALFALSGVSGGSLGVTAFVASEYGVHGWRNPDHTAPTDPLSHDFLSPAAGGLFFTDFIQRFLPGPIQVLDRSRAIESAWEQAFATGGDTAFSSSLRAFYAQRPGAPVLLLNATAVEDGKRAVHAPLDLRGLPDVYDLEDGQWTTSTVPMAGAVHNSARFTLVSPAGRVRDRRTGETVMQVVDGGYFENSGAATLADILDTIQGHLDEVEPIVLLLINDVNEKPVCQTTGSQRCELQPPTPGPHPSLIASEVLAPLNAIFATRDARGREAEFELAQLADAATRDTYDGFLRRVYFISLGTSEPKPTPAQARAYAEEPLGWSLSPLAQNHMAARAQKVVDVLLPDLRRSLFLPDASTATGGR